jgi:hypothetical protein
MFTYSDRSTPATSSLAGKLQRLVLEQPRAAAQIEQLVDVFLASTEGAARRDATMPRKLAADIVTQNLGSIITLTAGSAKGRRWLAEHVPDATDATTYCDHRCGIGIVLGALDAGLRLKDGQTGRIATRGLRAAAGGGRPRW